VKKMPANESIATYRLPTTARSTGLESGNGSSARFADRLAGRIAMRREGFLFRSSKRVRAVLIPGETVKKSLKPLHAPPPKLSSPMKTAMRAASHALALGVLSSAELCGRFPAAPAYANPASSETAGQLSTLHSPPSRHSALVRFLKPVHARSRAGVPHRGRPRWTGDKEHIDPALLVGVFLPKMRRDHTPAALLARAA